MFSTIRMWTHEWSDITSRSAFTCWTCHQAFSCGSALAAANSFSSLRLPREGASMRIAAIASAGGRGAGSARLLPDSPTPGNVSGAKDLTGSDRVWACPPPEPRVLAPHGGRSAGREPREQGDAQRQHPLRPARLRGPRVLDFSAEDR